MEESTRLSGGKPPKASCPDTCDPHASSSEGTPDAEVRQMAARIVSPDHVDGINIWLRPASPEARVHVNRKHR